MKVVDYEPKQVEVQKREKSVKINSLSFQINVVPKDIQKNINRINVSLQNYKKSDKLDLVIFPELALTGKNFQDPTDVSQYAELSGQGQQFKFASDVASKLNSYVILGYPEKSQDSDKYYNSAYVVDRQGKLILNYRKKHFHPNDKAWGFESEEGFQSLELNNHEGVQFKLGLGISDDINPYSWAESSKFEWGDYLLQQNVDVVVNIQSWVDPQPENTEGQSIKALVDYFLWRLRSLVNSQKELKYNKQWLFLIAGRVGKEENSLYQRQDDQFGKEKDHIFAGCSVAMKLNPEELIYNLDKRNEQILKSEATLE